MDAIDQRRHMTTVNMQENCNLNDQYQNSLRAAANVEFGTSLQQAKANQIKEWEQQEKEWTIDQQKKDKYK